MPVDRHALQIVLVDVKSPGHHMVRTFKSVGSRVVTRSIERGLAFVVRQVGREGGDGEFREGAYGAEVYGVEVEVYGVEVVADVGSEPLVENSRTM